MYYLRYLPQIKYSSGDLVFVEATNIMVRVKIKQFIKDSIVSTIKYEIPDGVRPDTVSEQIYGDPRYAWLIFYVNDIYDPVFDWMLDETSFKNYIQHKYGDNNNSGFINASNLIHEYYLENGAVTTFDTWSKNVVNSVNGYADSNSYEDFEVGDIIEVGIEQKMLIQILALDSSGSYKRISVFQVIPNSLANSSLAVLSVPLNNGETSKYFKTKLEYEEEINRNKRIIEVVEPQYLSKIMNELKIIVNYAEED